MTLASPMKATYVANAHKRRTIAYSPTRRETISKLEHSVLEYLALLNGPVTAAIPQTTAAEIISAAAAGRHCTEGQSYVREEYNASCRLTCRHSIRQISLQLPIFFYDTQQKWRRSSRLRCDGAQCKQVSPFRFANEADKCDSRKLFLRRTTIYVNNRTAGECLQQKPHGTARLHELYTLIVCRFFCISEVLHANEIRKQRYDLATFRCRSDSISVVNFSHSWFTKKYTNAILMFSGTFSVANNSNKHTHYSHPTPYCLLCEMVAVYVLACAVSTSQRRFRQNRRESVSRHKQTAYLNTPNGSSIKMLAVGRKHQLIRPAAIARQHTLPDLLFEAATVRG